MSDPPAPTTLAVYQADLTPLRGRWGQAWARSLGASKDTTVERARQAVLAGAVSRAPADALPYLADDAGGLERGPVEDDDEHRARIAQAWETWPWAGTRDAHEVVAAQLGFAGVTIRTAREWGMSDAATLWARWWVLVTQNGPFASDGAWDDAGTWDDGGTWDSDASLGSVSQIRRFFRRFSNARDVGFVRLLFNDNTDFWGPDSPFDSGTWDDEPTHLELRI